MERGPNWLRSIAAAVLSSFAVYKDIGITIDAMREIDAARRLEQEDEADAIARAEREAFLRREMS